MEQIRKPLQGVINIVRFNWHFYVLSFGLIISVLLFSRYLFPSIQPFVIVACLIAALPILISLLVSLYIYDLSALYKFSWIDKFHDEKSRRVVNINAGFDQTSALLKTKFSNTELLVFDFYDPLKHTEVSIKRARKRYSPFPNTQQIDTIHLPLENQSVDKIFVIFSAHEIRDEKERVEFFKELNRIVRPDGQIFIMEHLRDVPNFLAYNIGFFHFYSSSSWQNTFQLAELKVQTEIKITPFVSTYILQKNGNTL
jgi:SAM-dependent methyltransferase